MFFGLFKKHNMKAALRECQVHHIKVGFGQELSPDMFHMVTQTSLFKDINKNFKSKDLSEYGGLAWFCNQTVSQTLKRLESGSEVSSQILVLAEKMASVALLLGNSIHSLKLTKNDLQAILAAAETATVWVDSTSTAEEKDFYKTVLGN